MGDNSETRGKKVSWQLGLLKKGGIDSTTKKNCSGLKQRKHTARLSYNKPWEILSVCVFSLDSLYKYCMYTRVYQTVTYLYCMIVWVYLVCDSGENHCMGHERVAIYQSLCLWKVLHWNPKHKLMVEPVWNAQNHVITPAPLHTYDKKWFTAFVICHVLTIIKSVSDRNSGKRCNDHKKPQNTLPS